MYLVSITGARFSNAGSDVTNPLDWPGETTYGEGAMPAVNAPRFLRWILRSPDGRLGAMSLFGIDVSTPSTYRIYGVEGNVVDAVRATLLTAVGNGDVCTISGGLPTVKNYANVKFASYWQDKPRP